MITGGHSVEAVWSYTPRQVAGFLILMRKRRRHDAAELLHLNAMAARADPKQLKRMMKELTG